MPIHCRFTNEWFAFTLVNQKLFPNPPAYEKYMYIDISYISMKHYGYPSSDTWKVFLHLIARWVIKAVRDSQPIFQLFTILWIRDIL